MCYNYKRPIRFGFFNIFSLHFCESVGSKYVIDMHIPKVAWLTVNRSCNLRCQWCYASSSGFKSTADISLERAKNIISLVKAVGIKTVSIIGGEPTLWKDLFAFNDFCNGLPINTTLVTNTYAFRSEMFWKEYLKHPNTRMEPSLKAFDDASSLSITKIKDFDGIKLGMRRANAKFKNAVSIVYSTLTEGHLVDMVSTAVDLGAASVRVGICTPMSVDGRFTAPYTVEYGKMVAEVAGSYNKLVEITKGKVHFTLNTPLCIWPEAFVRDVLAHNRVGNGCQFQHRSGVIFDTDGQVLLCNSMLDCPVGKFGVDFNDTKSFLALLNSAKVTKIYTHINSYPSKECIGCSLFSRCRGGCPIMWTTQAAESVISSANKGGGWHGKIPGAV